MTLKTCIVSYIIVAVAIQAAIVKHEESIQTSNAEQKFIISPPLSPGSSISEMTENDDFEAYADNRTPVNSITPPLSPTEESYTELTCDEMNLEESNLHSLKRERSDSEDESVISLKRSKSDSETEENVDVVVDENECMNDFNEQLPNTYFGCPLPDLLLPSPNFMTTDMFEEQLNLYTLEDEDDKVDFLASISPFGHGLVAALEYASGAPDHPLDLTRIANVWNDAGNACREQNNQKSYWLCVAWHILRLGNKISRIVARPTLEFEVVFDSFKVSLFQSNLFNFELDNLEFANLIALVEARKWHWLTTAASSQSVSLQGRLRAITMNEWMSGSFGGHGWYQTIKDLEESIDDLFNGPALKCRLVPSKSYCTACVVHERRIRNLNSFSILDGLILAMDYFLNGLNVQNQHRPRMTDRFLQLYATKQRKSHSNDVSFHDWITFRFASIIPLGEDLTWSEEAFLEKNPIIDFGDEKVHENSLLFEERQHLLAYLRSSAKFWFKIMDENGDGYFDTNELLAYVEDAVHSINVAVSNYEFWRQKFVNTLYNRLRDLICTHTNAVQLKDLLVNPGTLSIVLNGLFARTVTFEMVKTDALDMKKLVNEYTPSFNSLMTVILHGNIQKLLREGSHPYPLTAYLNFSKESVGTMKWHLTEKLPNSYQVTLSFCVALSLLWIGRNLAKK